MSVQACKDFFLVGNSFSFAIRSTGVPVLEYRTSRLVCLTDGEEGKMRWEAQNGSFISATTDLPFFRFAPPKPLCL